MEVQLECNSPLRRIFFMDSVAYLKGIIVKSDADIASPGYSPQKSLDPSGILFT